MEHLSTPVYQIWKKFANCIYSFFVLTVGGTDGQRHTLIRPVERRAYQNKNMLISAWKIMQIGNWVF